MNTQRLTQVSVLITAGMVGGVVTHLMAPRTASAADAVKELRAQSLTLVDSANNPVGTFTTDTTGVRGPGAQRVIVLRAPDGRELWRAEDGVRVRPLSQR